MYSEAAHSGAFIHNPFWGIISFAHVRQLSKSWPAWCTNVRSKRTSSIYFLAVPAANGHSLPNSSFIGCGSSSSTVCNARTVWTWLCSCSNSRSHTSKGRDRAIPNGIHDSIEPVLFANCGAGLDQVHHGI